MLSIAAMSAGQDSYYTELAREDYYLEGGEPPGRWLGRGAKALGLTDSVDKEAFASLFAGLHPDGHSLVQRQVYADGRQRQPGWDLTFSAPKSVSVLWSQVDASTRKAIQDAHYKAVTVAVGYLEQEAAVSRRGKGGASTERCGLVVATFEHGTSRAQDPQLHTHALVVNLGRRDDGSWGSIRSRDLYLHKMAAGALYRAELAHELSHTLGLELVRDRFTFALAKVPESLSEVFSTRRAQIEEALAAAGLEGPRAAERAAMSTRTVKGHVARDVLLEQWRAVGEEHGFSQDEALALLHPGRTPLAVSESAFRETARKSVDACMQSQSHFTAREIVHAVASQHMAVQAEAIIRAVKSHLGESRDVVKVGEIEGRQHYSTRAMLDLERSLLAAAEASKTNSAHQVKEAVLDRTLKRRPTITQEQAEALRHITAGTGSVSCLVGMAGTGKTFVLDAAREAWEKAGYKVIGCALAGRAARELETKSGIKSDTLAKTLWSLDPSSADRLRRYAHGVRDTVGLDFKLDALGFTEKGKKKVRQAFDRANRRSKPLTLDANSIIVLDEAGMVGTADMERLVRLAEKSGAKLVMVGDPGQLQPIQAGAPFRSLVERLGAAHITTIIRQYEEWMRDAVRQFAEGDARGGLTQYALAERLKLSGTRDQAIAQLIEQWGGRRTKDLAETLILAGTRAEVGELNRRAQEARRAGGELKTRHHTRIHDTDIVEGDRVIFTKNDRKLGVYNGDLGTVERIRSPLIPWKSELTVRLDREEKKGFFMRHCRVTFGTRDYDNVELGYAVTTHKAQGATVDRTFVLAGGWMQDRELSYVQMSRAREETWVHAGEAEAGEDLSELVREMDRSRAKNLALDIVTRPLTQTQEMRH